VWVCAGLAAGTLPVANPKSSCHLGKCAATGRREPPNDVHVLQTHPKQWRRRDSRAPTQPPPGRLGTNGRRRGRKQGSLVRSGCQPHTLSASKESWRSQISRQ
jgi:hypothetical protein